MPFHLALGDQGQGKCGTHPPGSALLVEQIPYDNHGIFSVYLHQLQGCYMEALCSLQEEEDALKQDHSTKFSHQALVIFGDCALLYYYLTWCSAT